MFFNQDEPKDFDNVEEAKETILPEDLPEGAYSL